MKLAYVVSMFPCWSETFILNELISHNNNGDIVDVYSIKKCNETMVHDEAKQFISRTTYARSMLNPVLLFLHLLLVVTSPLKYIKVLLGLLTLTSTDRNIKIKALAVFALSPTFVFASWRNKTTHLHAHFATYPAVLAWIVGQFTGIPFTFTAHAHDIYFNQDLLPLISKDAAAIVTISEFNKRFILQHVGRLYEDRIKVIHCGIDLSKFTFKFNKEFNYSKERPLRILSIGRLTGIKGFKYLIEALNLLRNDGVAFECKIIGDGPMKAQLTQQVEEFGLSSRITFLGSKKSDEIKQYLDESDVFVLACATDKREIHDGIPVVFMEAMAYGIPVIGTRLSGIPELIRHMETGFCADPEDPFSLKQTIVAFLENSDKLNDITGRARNLIEKEYDIESNSLELRSIFG